MIAALRVVEHNVHVYRRTWRGSLMSSFLSPLLFLVAMGLGLGSLVNRTSGGIHGVPYLEFLAPGLLVNACVQTASFEMTFPVLGKVYWDRLYEAMLATPLRPRDLLAGDIAWVGLRFLISGSLFLAAMLLVGAVHSASAGLAIGAGVMTGLAFATPIYAFAVTQVSDVGFAVLQRLVVVPLLLFGGAFFPLDRLPVALQALAWMTPLAHGVALSRDFSLGRAQPGPTALHVAVLLAFIAAGYAVAARNLHRRMVK